MHLRKLAAKDIPYILEWMHDDSINRFFRFDAAAATEKTVAAFIAKAQVQTGEIHLACANEADSYLGTVSLKNIDRTLQTAEYAVSFRRCAQGSGAALFATRAVLDIAFKDLGLKSVYLNVLAENERAVRFYGKSGFLPMQSREKSVLVRGEEKPLCWFTMAQKEYEQRYGTGKDA